MAKSPGLPSDPNWDPKSKMHDEQGHNLFSDEGAESSPPTENQYASSSLQEARPYQPYGYETTYRSKAGGILTLGILGSICSMLGALGSLTYMFFFCFGLPFVLLGFLLSVIAFWNGNNELRAMKAGVMESRKRGMTLWGYWLGIFGTALPIFSVAYYFFSLFFLIGF